MACGISCPLGWGLKSVSIHSSKEEKKEALEGAFGEDTAPLALSDQREQNECMYLIRRGLS